jgi:hypothetical protein
LACGTLERVDLAAEDDVRKKITAPKLKPTFGLLIASSENTRFDPRPMQPHPMETELDRFIEQVKKLLPNLVSTAPLFYGTSAEDHTELVLLSTGDSAIMSTLKAPSSKYDLPTKSILTCAPDEGTESNQKAAWIWLESEPHNPSSETQFKTIRNEALRAFSDILLWIGPLAEEDAASISPIDLLVDSILDGKLIIHLAEDGQLRVLDYRLVDEPERILLNTKKVTDEHLVRLFKPMDDALLREELGFIVNPASQMGRRGTQIAERKIHDYFSENSPGPVTQWLAGRFDKVLQSIICLKGFTQALFEGLAEPWYGVDVAGHIIQNGEHPIEPEELRTRFGWSDSLANVYSGIRRDSTWTLYLLSSLAVFSAVAGALHLWPYWEWFWPTAELITVLLIVSIYAWVAREDLHGRWLFHRFLAEQIRYTRYGYPLLTYQMPLLAPLRMAIPGKHGTTQVSLTNPESWILKRVLVGAGPPKMQHAMIYQPTNLTEPLSLYVGHVIEDQRHYHAKTHHTMHSMEHRLHNLTKLGFIVTAVAVVAHFYIHATWLLIFTAALPSLAAAIHGIVTTHEMGRVGDLSKRTDQKLHHLQQRLVRLKKLPDNQARTWLQLREVTHESALVMSNVNQQWQELIQHHETSLPA